MKFLLIVFFVFGSFFSWSQYNSRGQSSYTREQMNRVENSINAPSINVSLEDLRGTWAYSISGCRAPSLSSESHRIEQSEIGFGTSGLAIVFDTEGGVRIEGEVLDDALYIRDGIKEWSVYLEEAGYSLNGNRITFEVPNPDESFLAYFRHNYLLPGRAGMNLVLADVNLDGIQSCGLDHISVLIFNKAD